MRGYRFPIDKDGNIIYDYSLEELNRRREYLEEVDKYSKMTYKDIQSSLLPGHQVQAIKCGYGKTTALRQFVCRPEVITEGVLIACQRIEYVNQLTYDITAMLAPEYRKLVIGLHSKSDTSKELRVNPNYLKDYNIVVTTHKRLLLESGGTLLNTNDRYNTLGERLGRKYIFIDEDPQFLTSIPTSKSLIGAVLSYIIDDAKELSVGPKDMDYRYVVKHMIEDLVAYEYGFEYRVDRYTPLCKNLTRDDLVKNSLRGTRFIHSLNVITKEIIRRIRKGEDLDSPIYYHIGMLSTEHIVIFDGTADITCSNSEDWKISMTTPRNLSVADIGIMPNTSLPRKPDLTVDYSEFVDAIVHLSNTHKKLLVCTWKDLKGDKDTCVEVLNPHSAVSVEVSRTITTTNSFVEYLKSNLPPYINNVEFITYMSGEERVTSQYSDCDAILFLGSFFIPNSEVSRLNLLKRSSQTTQDYTMALLVQAIYRTTARHDKPVSIYFSSDWSKDFIMSTMNQFHDLEDTTGVFHKFKYEYLLRKMKSTSRNQKYYQLIVDNFHTLITNGCVTINIPSDYDTKATKRSLSKLCSSESWIEFQSVQSKPQFRLRLIKKGSGTSGEI